MLAVTRAQGMAVLFVGHLGRIPLPLDALLRQCI